MSETKTLSGQCLCGAVKFTATPKREKFSVCHCKMCRRWAGGPFFAVDCGTDVTFQDETQIGIVQSSQWAERGFCKSCGSALFYRLKGDGSHQMAMGALEGADAYEFGLQVFIDKKPDGYDFANRTRTMTEAEIIAMFAPPAGESNG